MATGLTLRHGTWSTLPDLCLMTVYDGVDANRLAYYQLIVVVASIRKLQVRHGRHVSDYGYFRWCFQCGCKPLHHCQYYRRIQLTVSNTNHAREHEYRWQCLWRQFFTVIWRWDHGNYAYLNVIGNIIWRNRKPTLMEGTPTTYMPRACQATYMAELEVVELKLPRHSKQ